MGHYDYLYEDVTEIEIVQMKDKNNQTKISLFHERVELQADLSKVSETTQKIILNRIEAINNESARLLQDYDRLKIISKKIRNGQSLNKSQVHSFIEKGYI